MIKKSVLTATLILGLLVWKFSLGNVLPPGEKLWTGLACL